MKKKLTSIIITVALALCVSAVAFGCGKESNSPAQTDYTVTFDLNYAGAPAATVKTVKSGEKVEKPSDPTYSGYVFKGWFNGGVLFDFDSAVSSDITLLAMWNERGASVNPDECKLTFEETEGVEYVFERNKPATALKKEVVKFSVNTSPFYLGSPVVKVNDAEVAADQYNVYSFEVEKNTTIKVEGLEKDTSVMQGMGTAAKPYEIATPTQYMEFVTKANSANSLFAQKNYKLIADLDFKGYTIPVVEMYMDGTFDGNGKTIKNYVIESSENIGDSDEIEDSTNVGLFGRILMAKIKNLTLENFKIMHTSNSACYVGGLVGDAVASEISGVNVSGEIVGSASGTFIWSVGGIAGNARTLAAESYSGNTTDIIFCNADVDISGGQLGNFGGLVGRAASNAIDVPVLISNCSAEGNIRGGHSTGGLVGYMTAYTSITNCYSTGNVTAENTTFVLDVNAGGIVGTIDAYEVAITNCFTVSSVSAVASESGSAYRGYFYGGMDADVEPLHYIPSYIKAYYNRGGRIYETNNASDSQPITGDFRNKGTLLNTLGWKEERWNFGAGDYGYPKAKQSVQGYSVMVNFPGEQLEINKQPVSDSFSDNDKNHEADGLSELFSPLYFLFGTDGIYSAQNGVFSGFKGILSGNVSVGFFADEKCTKALPSSYLLNDNIGNIYIGFAKPLTSKYVYEVEGVRYEFSFNENMTAGADSAKYGYVYYGTCTPFEKVTLNNGKSYDIKYYFENTPGTLLGDSAFAFEDEQGTLYLTDFVSIYTALYPYTPMFGVWTYNDGTTFDFRADGTGTTSKGQQFTHSYDSGANTVTVTLGETLLGTFTYTEAALNNDENSSIFTKGDEKYGKYELDMYSRNIGLPSVEIDAGGKLVGTALANATVKKDEDNRLILEFDNQSYVLSRENGFMGVWSTASGNRVIELNGIGVYGIGYAEDSVFGRIIYAYDSEADVLQFYRESDMSYLGRAVIERSANSAKTLLGVTLGNSSFVLGLTDGFQGTWYGEIGDKFVFEFGNVYVNGDKSAVQYSYISREMITFAYGEDTYRAMFADGELAVKKNADIENIYARYDSYYGVELMTGDRALMLEFNGLGEFGEGKVAVTTPNEDYELEYTIDKDGKAIVTDGETVVYTIAYDAATKFYYIINEDGENTVLGIANPFTGSWVIWGNGIAVEAGVFNEKYEASGYYNGEMIKLKYYPNENRAEIFKNNKLQRVSLFIGEHGLMHRETDANGETSDVAMTEPDELAGIWLGAQEGSKEVILVDGVGLSSDYYIGLISYSPDGKSPKGMFAYFLSTYKGEPVVAVRIYVGTGFANYAVMRFTDKAGYNDMYNSLYNRGVFLNVFSFDDRSEEPSRFMFWEAINNDGLNNYESISDNKGNTFRFEMNMEKEAQDAANFAIGGKYRFVYIQFAGQKEEEYVYQIDYMSDDGKTIIISVTTKTEAGVEVAMTNLGIAYKAEIEFVVAISIDDEGNAQVTNIEQ